MPLKGMEIAIISTTSVPTKSFDQILKPNLLTLRDQISLRLLMQSHFTSKKELGDRALQLPLSAFPESSKDLPSFFFLFCMNLLHNEPSNKPLLDSAREKKVTPTTEQSEESCTEEPQQRTQMKPKATFSLNLTSERLTAVLKCSLSLALAVLFGVLFSRDNGYWSGLTVAITMTPHRESTFKLANLRAQGTALGSVYGVLGAIISQNLMELRFLTLLPWIIFTSFLRNSRMYAQAGGMAAIISALIILGRRDYGSPTAFAITRLTETFIGFSCSIFVEVLVQPTRASTLARNQLHQSLKTVRECKDCVLNPGALKEKERRLKGQVNKLKKYINEADAEPNLWFSPFPTACYYKLYGSLNKIVEMVYFVTQSMELLFEVSRGPACEKLIQESMSGDVEQFKKLVASSLKCFEEVTQLRKPLTKLEKKLQRKCTSDDDIELGKQQEICGHGNICASEEECDKIITSFVNNAKEVIEKLDGDNNNNNISGELKSQVILCMASFGFCIKSWMKEVREMERGILELVQWENPGKHIDLNEIYCEVKKISTS